MLCLNGFELYSRWVLLLVQLNSIHLYGKTNQQTNKQVFFSSPRNLESGRQGPG